MPMQVHIEAQIAEVTLTGRLQYGVNWYFENAVTTPSNADGSGGPNLPSAAGRGIWGMFRVALRAMASLGHFLEKCSCDY